MNREEEYIEGGSMSHPTRDEDSAAFDAYPFVSYEEGGSAEGEISEAYAGESSDPLLPEDRRLGKKGRRSLLYWLSGGMLTERFFRRNRGVFLFATVLALLSISHGYTCIGYLQDIKRTEAKLKDLRFQSITLQTELTGRTRQSEIKDLLERKGSELAVSETPYYEIER